MQQINMLVHHIPPHSRPRINGVGVLVGWGQPQALMYGALNLGTMQKVSRGWDNFEQFGTFFFLASPIFYQSADGERLM